MSKTLLPSGCYDVLPPRARLETELTHRLLNSFEAYGYEQVAPPMLEYTDSLLAGRGAALSPQIFRVMDPAAQRVMGFRADMTLQIGRIATNRLSHAPRPLRLSYAGTILRMQPQGLHAERQLRQAGIELIGASDPAADAEVIVVAAKALEQVGITEVTIDLNTPPLVGAILADSPLDNEELQQVFDALAHKDSTTLAGFDVPHCALLTKLMQITGKASDVLAALPRFELPEAALSIIEDLKAVVALVTPHLGEGMELTIDLTERSGFDYYSGIGFAFFVRGASTELGRGGRYLAGAGAAQESATGCTFYADALRTLLSAPSAKPRVYIAEGLKATGVEALIEKGYTVLYATPDAPAPEEAAKKLGCESIYQRGKLTGMQ